MQLHTKTASRVKSPLKTPFVPQLCLQHQIMSRVILVRFRTICDLEQRRFPLRAQSGPSSDPCSRDTLSKTLAGRIAVCADKKLRHIFGKFYFGQIRILATGG